MIFFFFFNEEARGLLEQASEWFIFEILPVDLLDRPFEY